MFTPPQKWCLPSILGDWRPNIGMKRILCLRIQRVVSRDWPIRIS
jgi:hypothetical protein